MGGVQSTADNLRAAVGGETYEVETMYPPFIKDAEDEQNKKAYNAFKWAWEVEKVHASLYAQALELMETSGREADGPDYYVCPVCGYTHEERARQMSGVRDTRQALRVRQLSWCSFPKICC